VSLRKSCIDASLLKNLLRFALLALFALSSASARQFAAPDSLIGLQPDSLRPPRYKTRFIPFIGNLERSADSSSRLHSTQFVQSDAISAADLFWREPGVFIRDLGQPGQPIQLNIRGLDDRSAALLLDGRPLRDPITGRYNLYDIPLEYLDQIELENSSASLFAAPSSAGGTINLVSHQYDNVHPMTKLRFLQGPFGHILTDGIFAQNLSRGVNAMFGFQRLVTDGRFPNSQYDSWNIRARVRYNITENLNAWISDFYNKATTGLNGGIDPFNSPTLFDEVTAVVRDESTVQTVSRHDFTLGLVGKFLPDTTSRTKVLLYYSMIDREYSTGATQYTPPTFSDIQKSALWGTKLEQQIDLSPLDVELGGEIERRTIQKGFFLPKLAETYSSTQARAIIRPFEWLSGESSARFESLRSDDALSWSLRVEGGITDWLSIWGGLSRSVRFPTIQELYWVDSSLVRVRLPGKETHSLLEFGFQIKTTPLSVSLQGFKRRIDNAIILRQAEIFNDTAEQFIMFFPQVDVQGIAADISTRFWRFALAGNFTYTDYRQQENSTQPFPRFASFSEFSYSDTFGDRVVDLKVAVRLKAISRHFGLQLIPEQLSFTQQNSALSPGFAMVDFYTVVRIGDAHVSLTWENPFGVNAMMVPYYPLLGRNVKLGVNWVFTD
jgi:outer membrane receptor protein involved in Fe transport